MSLGSIRGGESHRKSSHYSWSPSFLSLNFHLHSEVYSRMDLIPMGVRATMHKSNEVSAVVSTTLVLSDRPSIIRQWGHGEPGSGSFAGRGINLECYSLHGGAWTDRVTIIAQRIATATTLMCKTLQRHSRPSFAFVIGLSSRSTC